MTTDAIRYFLSYTGITLPLKLTGELKASDLRNRNPWFEAELLPVLRQRVREVLE